MTRNEKDLQQLFDIKAFDRWRAYLSLLFFVAVFLFVCVFAVWESKQLTRWEHYGWHIVHSDDCKDYDKWKSEAYRLLGDGYQP